MSKPFRKTYSLTAADADGIATSQTPLAAGNLTLDGVLISGGVLTLSEAQPVTITAAGNETARTFTVTGTAWDDSALTEAIAGPNATIATGTKHFKTVTQIAVDDATAGAVTAGIAGTAELPWIPLDHWLNPFNYSYFVDIGTATFQVESTLDNLQDSTITPVVNATVEASGSSDAGGSSTAPCTGIRVKVTAFTSGDIVLTLVQAGR